MRILQVINSMDPRSGGPTAVVRNTVRHLRELSHDVAILTTTIQSYEPWDAPEAYRQRVESEPLLSGVGIHWVEAWGRRGIWQRYAYAPRLRSRIRDLFDSPDTRPDVVHINGTFSYLTQQTAAAARRYSVPYIVTPMGSLDSTCLAHGSALLKRLYLKAVVDKDLRHAARVQATCATEATNVRSLAADCRIDVVPHGVDSPADDTSPAREAFLRRFPQLREGRYVLFMSRIHPIKRLDLLIRAFALLQDEFADLSLVVAGNDAGGMQAAKELEKSMKLGERMLFTGFLSDDSKAGALESAAAFVLPSEHENFGVAVVEAMAHGAPVLVTRGVASHEFVDESGCGYTVDSTPDALADGLRRILTGRREDFGTRGQQYVCDHLTWESVIRRLVTMYASAVEFGASRG